MPTVRRNISIDSDEVEVLRKLDSVPNTSKYLVNLVKRDLGIISSDVRDIYSYIDRKFEELKKGGFHLVGDRKDIVEDILPDLDGIF